MHNLQPIRSGGKKRLKVLPQRVANLINDESILAEGESHARTGRSKPWAFRSHSVVFGPTMETGSRLSIFSFVTCIKRGCLAVSWHQSPAQSVAIAGN